LDQILESKVEVVDDSKALTGWESELDEEDLELLTAQHLADEEQYYDAYHELQERLEEQHLH
jgi:hypothetical protein